MSNFEDCLAAIRKAAKAALPDDQLTELVETLDRRAATLKRQSGGTLGDAEAYGAAAKELGEQAK